MHTQDVPARPPSYKVPGVTGVSSMVAATFRKNLSNSLLWAMRRQPHNNLFKYTTMFDTDGSLFLAVERIRADFERTSMIPMKASRAPRRYSNTCDDRRSVRLQRTRFLLKPLRSAFLVAFHAHQFSPPALALSHRTTHPDRYQNEPGLSGSCPLAAASRYGAKGTLRMLRRSASASRVGTNPDEDTNAEGFEVDEWTPMLRCSTSPSLATMTTPKVIYKYGEAFPCLRRCW